MMHVKQFKEVARIKVWVNKKYPEVVGVTFTDGTQSQLNVQIPTLKFA